MNFYWRIIISTILSTVAVGVFSYILVKGDGRFHVHTAGRMSQVFDSKTNYDVLFVGSSRTHTTIYPAIIDSITGLSTYNAGVDGSNVFEFCLIIKGYLLNHPPPKMIFLSIDATSLKIDKKLEYPMQYFNYTGNAEIEQTLQNNSRYNVYLLKNFPFLNSIYYNDYVKTMALKGLAGETELNYAGRFENKGFWSLGDSCFKETSILPYRQTSFSPTMEDLQYLHAIIDLCKKEKIQLIFTYAPEYKKKYQQFVTNFDEFIAMMNSFSKVNNLSFFQDDSIDMCSDRCNFSDVLHVNLKGAITYSTIIGERINVLLKH